MMADGNEISGSGRLDVYVHLEQIGELAFLAGLHQGTGRAAAKGAPGKSRWVWSLKLVAIIGLVGLAGTIGYRAGGKSTSQLAGGAFTPAVGAAMAGDLAPSSEQIPPALAQQLASTPEVTPPPGGPSLPHAPTGPAAFGLHE